MLLSPHLFKTAPRFFNTCYFQSIIKPIRLSNFKFLYNRIATFSIQVILGVKVTIQEAIACYLAMAIYHVFSPKSSNTDRRSLVAAESFQIRLRYSRLVNMAVLVAVLGHCILRIFSFSSR